MGVLERRLARLEERGVPQTAFVQDINRRVLRRLSDEELGALEIVLKTGEQAPVVQRVEQIREEVLGELTASS